MRITFLTGHLAKERHMLLYELALDLSAHGAFVTVITGFPSRRITNETRQYYLDHPIEKINDNLIIKRVGSRKGEGKGLFQRYVRYLKLSKRIKKEALKTPTDCFYIYSSPPFLGYHSKALSKVAPVVYNAQDIFPDSLFFVKPFVKKTPLKWFFESKEKKVYKYCDSIITISEAMKATIAQRCDDVNKIKVIYNWSDFNALKNVERKDNRLFQERNIPTDKFIVSYGGDVGMFQNWDVIIDSFKKLEDVANLVVFGNGTKLDYVRNRIKNENISNIFLLPMQPKNRVSEVYSLGDLELVPLAQGLSGFALPSKLYNVFACKKPVLAMLDKKSEYYNLINENAFGFSIEPNNSDLLIKVVKDNINNLDLKTMGIKGFDYLKVECSRSTQTTKYFNCLLEACIKHQTK